MLHLRDEVEGDDGQKTTTLSLSRHAYLMYLSKSFKQALTEAAAIHNDEVVMRRMQDKLASTTNTNTDSSSTATARRSMRKIRPSWPAHHADHLLGLQLFSYESEPLGSGGDTKGKRHDGHDVDIDPDAPQIYSLLDARDETENFHTFLKEQCSIYTSLRCGCIRTAFYVYNTIDEVEIFAQALQRYAASLSLTLRECGAGGSGIGNDNDECHEEVIVDGG